MRARRPLLAAAAAFALVASGLVTGGVASATPSAASPAPSTVTPGPGGYVPRAVDWTRCPKKDGFPKDFECGRVVVPLDWSDPSGSTISLAVTRVVHTTKRYQGVLLLNPGGPGGSGTYLPALKKYVPKKGGDTYDWVGFDPRGVGDSTPALRCDSHFLDPALPRYVPTRKVDELAWISKAKGYAAACGAKNGALLAQVNTVNAAKDLDAIRVALGQEQINYFGFSYGTYLGQVYATLFPSHLRRTVFDSTVDPRKVWYDLGLDQSLAFGKIIKLFFAWIAKHDRVYHLGTTQDSVSEKFYATEHRLDLHHLGKLGGSEWNDTFLSAGYAQYYWPNLAKAFSGYVVKHDPKAFEDAHEIFDGPSANDNGLAVFTTVECNEGAYPSSYSAFRADYNRVSRVAPFNTWGGGWFLAPCLYWPAPRTTPVEVDGSGVSSVLMIDETLDGATPYEGSIEVRRRFPNAVLLAEPGGTNHADSLSGDRCVDDTIAAYLRDGTLPKRKAGAGADTTCKPLPTPKPSDLIDFGGPGSGSARARLALQLASVH